MTIIKNQSKASQNWSLSLSKGLKLTKLTENSNHKCIYSPFEEGKSANADAGDVLINPKKYSFTINHLQIIFNFFSSKL